jgi:hypothetical protein
MECITDRALICGVHNQRLDLSLVPNELMWLERFGRQHGP